MWFSHLLTQFTFMRLMLYRFERFFLDFLFSIFEGFLLEVCSASISRAVFFETAAVPPFTAF